MADRQSGTMGLEGAPVSEGTQRLMRAILATELKPRRPSAPGGIGPLGGWLVFLVFVYFLI